MNDLTAGDAGSSDPDSLLDLAHEATLFLFFFFSSTVVRLRAFDSAGVISFFSSMYNIDRYLAGAGGTLEFYSGCFFARGWISSGFPALAAYVP